MSDLLVARGAPAPSQDAPPSQERIIDPARLRRAMNLGAVRLGPAQFRVSGSNEPHYDVNLELDPPCTCMDQWFHGRGCKHELIARAHNGDAIVITALGHILLAQEQHMQQLAGKRKRTQEGA